MSRDKIQQCGHGIRYRNKRGCVKCRRENGATIARHDAPPERIPQSSGPRPMAAALAKAGLTS